MDPTAKEAFQAWCKTKKMSVHDALCLAFVPIPTYMKVFTRKSLAPQYRLYLLTGLKELALTAEENREYLAMVVPQKKRIEYIDQEIARHFIGTWNTTGNFPDLRYKLVVAGKGNPPKEQMTKKITDEVIDKMSGPSAVPLSKADKSNGQGVEVLIGQIDAIYKTLQSFMPNASKEDFTSLIMQRRQIIQRVYGSLNVLLDDRPHDAASIVRDMKHNFSHTKIEK